MRDQGLFGPGSVAWRLHSEPALLVGGLRALMLQALHPLAIAAVRDFSDYKSDVWGRFNRTSGYVATTVFGDTAAAEKLGASVRRVHRRVRGVDSVTGLAYSADDPQLLLWIHTTLVDSFLVAYERYVAPLDPADADRYVEEMVRQAELVGLPASLVPARAEANRAFIQSLEPVLQLTETASEALDTFLHPPLPAHRRPWWWITTEAAIAILPDRAVELYGLRRRPAVGAAIRPLVSFGSRWTRRHAEPRPSSARPVRWPAPPAARCPNQKARPGTPPLPASTCGSGTPPARECRIGTWMRAREAWSKLLEAAEVEPDARPIRGSAAKANSTKMP